MGISTSKSTGVSVLGKTIHRSSVADPQNIWLPLFTITGVVVITSLVAHRTVIQAGGASTMQFRHSALPSILDDGTLAITGDAVDTFYTCDFDPTGPIINGVGIVPGAVSPFAMTGAGDIEVTMTAAAGTGSMEFWISYLNISSGSIVAV